MKRVTNHNHAGHYHGTPFDRIVLAHDERHLRRKVLTLEQGEQILVDLPEAIAFEHGDVLILEDGRMAEIVAADEALYAITPRDRPHLSELAWHLGNRHLPAQLEESRIVILRDHVIKAMLQGLGAKVTEITAPFHPLHGAYHSGHGHSHAHDHGHDHQHLDHAHG
ncbi:urease accessory protein UreE [Candidatus Phyllobacterium onerii]|uniref:urease accessory protein UreE n=1 Tax=Candidatus Phyllobacterium onerii TaxID=3020828 RepID=UPI00232CFC83|nr:urease accessory protein UreE [Phyllobacterium sp. IY22]